MADDESTSSTGAQQQSSDRLRELADKHGGMSPGMTSPDSTQAPLRADTGEPDQDATRGLADGAAMRGMADGAAMRRAQGDEPVGDEGGR